MHLYFVKLFGCLVVEGDVAIDTASFSSSILNGTPNPYIYLGFGQMTGMPVVLAGGSDLAADVLDGKVVFATWFYQVGDLCVNLLYAAEGEFRTGLTDAWHPRLGSKTITLNEW